VYRDYVAIRGGDYTRLTHEWRLDSSVTPADYQLWESHMVLGFERCFALDSNFGGSAEHMIACRRTDTLVARSWREERSTKGIPITTVTWEDFKQFLQARFLAKSTELDEVVNTLTWRRLYH
jgi:hypothetical protein